MFNRKHALAIGALSLVALLLVAFIATMAWKGHRKKVEDARLAGMVVEATAELRRALAAAPGSAGIARLEEWLQSAKSSPNAAMGSAAEHYLLGARQIARLRADTEWLERQAAASRQVLHRHMDRSFARGPGWIQQAAELKRRVESDHAELGRQLKALDELLSNFPEATKRVSEHVAAASLIDAKEIEAARARAQATAQRAGAALEELRKLTP